MGQVFGVQALIGGNFYYPSIFRWLLQIQVIDAESGQIMGRSFVEINYLGAEGMKDACRIAVQNLTREQIVDEKVTGSLFGHLFPFSINSCKSRRSKADRREVCTNNNHTGQK